MLVSTAATATPDSWTLVTAAQQGDGHAFGELYLRYSGTVYRYFLARTANSTLAEDLTGDTFLRALRAIGTVSYRGADISAWLISIARNLTIDHLRSARHRLESPTGDIAEHTRHAPGPEELVLREARRDELRTALRALTEDQFRCVTLRFLHEHSVAETARILGRDVRAVRALQYRAVRRLAELLSTPSDG